MLGFLFKVVLVAAIVVGIVGYVGVKKGSLSLSDLKMDPAKILGQLPVDKNVLANFRQVKPEQVGSLISSTLDSLVTHPGKNAGPVVLGVKVSNDTIGTITDVLMGLPTDQLNQVKTVICTPPSATPNITP